MEVGSLGISKPVKGEFIVEAGAIPGFIIVLGFIIWVLSWVYRDAHSRGLDGGIWVAIVLFLNIPGLLLYMALRDHLSRPRY